MRRQILTGILGLIIFSLVFSLSYWKSRDFLFQIFYDLSHSQTDITRKQSVDEILQQFETVAFENLDPGYLNSTNSNDPKFKSILGGSTFYKIKRSQINIKVAGQFRVKDFMAKDQFYRKSLFDKDFEQYWLIDKKLLYKIIELQQELKAKEYNPKAFWIRYGHRPPQLNSEVNGANFSRHINGQAADLVIKDVNQDGKYSEEDKTIVLDLVENTIIVNEGGVGRYPGTRTVHIDVRGKRARWDDY